MSTPDLMEQLDKTLDRRVVNRHSLFQLKHFVIGKEPTNQRRLWRCLEEMKVRREGLLSLKTQMEDTQDNIELTRIKLERLENDYMSTTSPTEQEGQLRQKEYIIHGRKLTRDIERMGAAMRKLAEQYHEQSEEAEFFLKAFQHLEKREKLRPFDDFDAQLEYWNERFGQALNTRVLLQLPLDAELVQSAMALPEGSPVRKQVVTLLENQHKQFQALKAKAELPPSTNGGQ